MADLYVKAGRTVEHDGVRYGVSEQAGAKLPGLSQEQAQNLLNVGAVQTTDPANGASNLDTHQPTDEEIKAAAEQAGVSSQDGEQKRGIFR